MRLILFTLFIVLASSISAQKVIYTYDAAGNREKREKAAGTRSSSEEATEEIFTEELGKSTVNIYPNPTEGYFKVEITNFDRNASASLAIYNAQGVVLLKQNVNSPVTDLDIYSRPSGLYILQITLDGESSTWKIIKK